MTFSFGMGGLSATGCCQTPAPKKANADVAMDWRWDCWFAVSTKFPFSQSELNVRRGAHQT
jgi:hypothetical protein